MKILARALLGSITGFVLVGGAGAADLPTKKQAAAPQVVKSCFDSFYSYLDSTPKDCPLTWQGITLYGTIDVGAGYSSHGANFNKDYPQGVAELIVKNSQGQKWQLVPSGLQRSNIGAKAKEEFAAGWFFVGNINTDFDPYSLRLSNGPASLVDNNNKTIGNQSANSDSNRAGQFDNTQGFVGISNSAYGTLTVGRLNSYSAETVTSYDAMEGAYAFSLIGNSATYVSGVGDTETTRYETAVKYFWTNNNFRAGALWQFGGYSSGNGSNGAYQIDVGADYGGFSFDALYSYAKDAVSLSTYGANPLPAGVGQGDLKATLADINGAIIAGKYINGPLKLYGGYEYAVYSPPSDTYPGGFTSLGDYTVLPGAVNVTNYIHNKQLQVAWVGARYAIRSDIDIAGAYYIAHQNNYAPAGAKSTVCGPNTVSAVAGSTPQGSLNSYCAGNLQAISALLDYRPVKRVDLYGGLMYSFASGGIASGYIHNSNFAPTVGLRVSF